MTFSIVARDPNTGNIAVCGGSHWFAYSTVVPFALPGIGAVATQAECNITFGPDGLDLLEKGIPANKVLDSLLKTDSGENIRQVLLIDKKGNTAAHTGNKCVHYAFHHQEQNLAIAGNMLLNQDGIPAMIDYYKKSKEPFGAKLIRTLQIGQKIGGDIRGKRSAGLLMVKPKATKRSWEGTIYNLRIDDHRSPFKELERLYHIAKTYNYMAKGDYYNYERNDTDKAVFYYQKAYELSPDNQEVAFWYAKLLHNVGKIKQSMKIIKDIEAKNVIWHEYWKRVEESES